jgi:hypothetical protein
MAEFRLKMAQFLMELAHLYNANASSYIRLLFLFFVKIKYVQSLVEIAVK